MDISLLQSLIQQGENEWIELKEKKTGSMDFGDLGQYFSALSNGASLKKQDAGYLIIGVNDKKEPVGTSYLAQSEQQQKLKYDISQHTYGLTFIDIHELNIQDKRVVVLEIPPAIIGHPTGWKGHYYARHGESLCPLSVHELETIRSQPKNIDRSKQLLEKVTIDHLDEEAVRFARQQFKDRNADVIDIDQWDTETFLKKSGVMIDNKITYAGIVLLGKKESAHLIDGVIEMTWVLKDQENKTLDHKHYGPPFLLNIEKLTSNIRNLTVRQLPDGTLFPIEMPMYDHWVLREVINNCIAHQDYSLNGRITLTEYPDRIVLINKGQFLPGSIEHVIESNAPSRTYKNYLLTQIMYNFKMSDRMGSGIYNMFNIQKKRGYPLPTYGFTNDEIQVDISGVVLDGNYTKLMINNPSISIQKAILLDKLQKGISVTKEEAEMLRIQNLIEGRYPKIYPSLGVSQSTNKIIKYISNKGLDKDHYEKLIIALIKQNPNGVSRQEIDELLYHKLPDIYVSDKDKKRKISNYLSDLRIRGLIVNEGSDFKSLWKLKN